MVKIRLTRMGDKKSPFYRIIVADSRAPRDGKFIDIVGTYNPLSEPAEIKIDAEKAKHWLTVGAKPSDTVKAMFVNAGIIENAKKAEDKNEQALRSGYGALIHVVYTDGDYVEVQLENGQLPEAYNDFRDELWDYMIPYMNKGRGEGEQIPDWRDMIDQWGEENLRSKYPYIR